MKQLFTKHYWGDKDIQLVVGQILRIGVTVASVVILGSGLLYLLHHGGDPVPDYAHFSGTPETTPSLGGIVALAFSGNVPYIVLFGALLLVCTPIMRVIGSLFGFLLEKDTLYVYITLIVLAVIVFSILMGVKA